MIIQKPNGTIDPEWLWFITLARRVLLLAVSEMEKRYPQIVGKNAARPVIEQ